MFSEYVPMQSGVQNLFYVQAPLTGANRRPLPPINCQYLTSARNLFCQANIQGPLKLRNTSGITDMTSMFMNSRLESVEGLDTSSAVHIDSMF